MVTAVLVTLGSYGSGVATGGVSGCFDVLFRVDGRTRFELAFLLAMMGTAPSLVLVWLGVRRGWFCDGHRFRSQYRERDCAG